jgi:hypothetical protein
MTAGATHGLSFRLPRRRNVTVAPRRDRAFEIWRASVWGTAAIGTAALVTTALNVVPGPTDEIVMASAYTLTGVLAHLAPVPE